MTVPMTSAVSITRSRTEPRLPRRGRQGGFTLLEVLAAFVVFIMVFGAVLETLSMAGRNARRSAEITEAALWAQSKLDAVGIESELRAGSEAGRFDDRYSYRLEIEPWFPPIVEGADFAGQPAVAVDLFRVELTVIWSNGSRERERRFVTVRSRLKEGNV